MPGTAGEGRCAWQGPARCCPVGSGFGSSSAAPLQSHTLLLLAPKSSKGEQEGRTPRGGRGGPRSLDARGPAEDRTHTGQWPWRWCQGTSLWGWRDSGQQLLEAFCIALPQTHGSAACSELRTHLPGHPAQGLRFQTQRRSRGLL